MANTPDFTTATACSKAVTGVGATDAFGSQRYSGNTAALTPKPKNVTRYTKCSVDSFPATKIGLSTPPGKKSIVVP